MERGTIVLIRFPFTDYSSEKLRPALIVSADNKKDEEFASTGLKKDSVFRMNKIATVDKEIILGRLGEVSKLFFKTFIYLPLTLRFMGNNKKIPFKFKLYLAAYPMKIFFKSLMNKFNGGEKMENFNLNGKKAIVFGVANDQSIAWHIAKKLDDNGVRVALGYQERAEQLVKPLLGMLKNPFAAKCDVVDDVQLTEFFGKIDKEFGKVDFLIHSIAFAKREHLQGNFYEVDRRGYQVAQEVSAYSLAELTRRALPIMNGNGSIIAMTFDGSIRVYPSYNIMGVVKAALESSVRYLASDVGEKGIRVNAISAGPIKTLAASGISDFHKMLDHAREKAPLKRNIDADDVGNLALFLCSDMSRNITGQVIYVDAGYSIMGI